MISKILTGVTLSLVIALTALGWYTKALLNENAVLEQNQKVLKSSNQSLLEAINVAEKEKKEIEIFYQEEKILAQQSEARLKSLHSEVRRLKETDEEVKSWTVVRIPNALTKRLRDYAIRAKSADKEDSPTGDMF